MAAKKKTKKTPTKKTTTKAVAVIETESEERLEGVMLTPRQALFCEYYYDSNSPTWGNAKQSAIRAGFTEETASRFTYVQPKWLSDFISQQGLSAKIERHFQEVMSLPTVTQAMGAFGPIEKTVVIQEEVGVYVSGTKKGQPKFKKSKVKVPVMVPNMGVIKAKTDVAKIAAPAHNPDMYGKKDQKKFSFEYNVIEVRNQYKPS